MALICIPSLPVRAVYGDGRVNNETNIGLNPLTSDKPIWFAGPDVVASLLYTRKPPKILRAIRFEVVGIQKGMKSELGKGSNNPRRDDFFRKVIEERKGKDKSDPLYYFLKILANAGCYGIYAEVNRFQTGKNDAKQVGIFSGDAFTTDRKKGAIQGVTCPCGSRKAGNGFSTARSGCRARNPTGSTFQ